MVRRVRALIILGIVAVTGGLGSAGAVAAPPAAPPPPPAAVATPSAPPPPPATRNVVLVTLDGVRPREIFGGMDPTIAAKPKQSGIYDLERARRLYDRPTPEERRAALLPFFWGTLVPQGIALGDPARGSRVTMRNPYGFSYPGYMELLTGRYQPLVTSNDLKRYPLTTFLEFARAQLGLPAEGVAVFSTWEAHRLMAARNEGAVFVNAGYEKVPEALATPLMSWLGDYQMHEMALWEESRPDAPAFRLALEYLKARRPRLLYIALGDTDDWAHARRYDRLLDCLHIDDEYLRLLWETLQSMEEYRGRTTLLVTTDHGRGLRPKDWSDHDSTVPGSSEIWLAAIGPDTPARGDHGPAPTVYQADVAATILKLLGLDWRAFDAGAGPPIDAAFAP